MAVDSVQDDDDDEGFVDEDNPFDEMEEWPSGGKGKKSSTERAKSKVLAPAIALILAGALGVMMSVVTLAICAVAPPPVINPNDPPWIQDFNQGQSGPFAVAIQSIFIVYNLVIIYGASQMMRLRGQILATVVSVMAIVNVGSCCCVIGLPIGIWSMITLSQPDVSKAFDLAA